MTQRTMPPIAKSIKLIALFMLLGLLGLLAFRLQPHSLPVVAIANWGPHSSLEETLRGMKEGLSDLGIKENQNVIFEYSDVNFDQTLIMQMLAKLKAAHPKLIVAVGTPIAQAAKGTFKDIPIVFTDVTDPVEAKLLSSPNHPNGFITGASDKQDLNLLLAFAKKILPHAKRIGLLYATGEANDAALVKMMNESAKHYHMEVIAIPIDHPREIPLRMQAFKNKVDFIYVGTSGPIQPSLPAIIAEADKMNIPVFNADSDAVKKDLVLGSFGVSYYQVGVNTAKLIAKILADEKSETLTPLFPTPAQHHGFISKKRADKMGLALPAQLDNIIVFP